MAVTCTFHLMNEFERCLNVKTAPAIWVTLQYYRGNGIIHVTLQRKEVGLLQRKYVVALHYTFNDSIKATADAYTKNCIDN